MEAPTLAHFPMSRIVTAVLKWMEESTASCSRITFNDQSSTRWRSMVPSRRHMPVYEVALSAGLFSPGEDGKEGTDAEQSRAVLGALST
ncbi:hypothetical protein AXG93_949s1050 [Marchantia polymorpha subsp. ruderalis]|uniref:Uncharacterized protein n=1 Tax=Marchantia polymorpha subsp. ruderalis TaxID=1480154 RepID=A0A176W0D4_MARPO|nr:hypothetical protein AXG93_949s1050 [Marchantia polymorpha subsp. ruderalis]